MSGNHSTHRLSAHFEQIVRETLHIKLKFLPPNYASYRVAPAVEATDLRMSVLVQH